jgi:hypothetical protein
MKPALLLLPALAAAADWAPLFNGKSLDGWQSRGDGVWTVLADGTLTGQRNPRGNPPPDAWPMERARYNAWLDQQAWLYTAREFREYDLSMDYWLRMGGNSGIALHDTSRGEYGLLSPPDYRRTPSKVAYEIQLINLYNDPNPTGSIYGIAKARAGLHRDNQWNRIEISVRKDMIRVRVNGEAAAEAPPDPKRPSAGPIGLQLHDAYSVVMFRNIRIREVDSGVR